MGWVATVLGAEERGMDCKWEVGELVGWENEWGWLCMLQGGREGRRMNRALGRENEWGGWSFLFLFICFSLLLFFLGGGRGMGREFGWRMCGVEE